MLSNMKNIIYLLQYMINTQKCEQQKRLSKTRISGWNIRVKMKAVSWAIAEKTVGKTEEFFWERVTLILAGGWW